MHRYAARDMTAACECDFRLYVDPRARVPTFKVDRSCDAVADQMVALGFGLRATENRTPLQLLCDRPKHPRRHLCLQKLQLFGGNRKAGRFASRAAVPSAARHETASRRHIGYQPRSAEGSNRAFLLISSTGLNPMISCASAFVLRNVSHAMASHDEGVSNQA